MAVVYLEPSRKEDIIDERYDRFVIDFGTDNTEFNSELENKRLLKRNMIPIDERPAYAGGLEF